MMNCHHCTRLISESQDRPLTLAEELSLKVHMMVCSGCKNFSLQLPFLSQAMKSYAKGDDKGDDKPMPPDA